MNGIECSLSQLATEFGLDRATARKRLAANNIQPSGQRGGYPTFRLRDVILALTTGQAQKGLADLNPYERRAYVASERDLLKLDVERGNLLAAEDVREEIGRIVKIVVRSISTVADRLERDKRVSPDVVIYVDGVMSALRDEIAAAVAE